MYNTLLIKNDETNKVQTVFHGELVNEIMNIRIDEQTDLETNRLFYGLSKKEVKKVIEYFQEFLRLTENFE